MLLQLHCELFSTRGYHNTAGYTLSGYVQYSLYDYTPCDSQADEYIPICISLFSSSALWSLVKMKHLALVYVFLDVVHLTTVTHNHSCNEVLFNQIRSHEKFPGYSTEISSSVSQWYVIQEWPWCWLPLDRRQQQCQESVWRGELPF